MKKIGFIILRMLPKWVYVLRKVDLMKYVHSQSLYGLIMSIEKRLDSTISCGQDSGCS